MIENFQLTFQLTPKTASGNTTANSYGKRVSNSWSGYNYSKTTRTKARADSGKNSNLESGERKNRLTDSAT